MTGASSPSRLPAQLDALARAAERLRQDDDGEVKAIGLALESWLSGEGAARLDAALGLVPLPGRRRPQTVATLQSRDELLRTMAARFFPAIPVTEQARRLDAALRRYRAAGWRFDRTKGECPHRDGTLLAACWRILKLRDHAPSERTIRRVLACWP